MDDETRNILNQYNTTTGIFDMSQINNDFTWTSSNITIDTSSNWASGYLISHDEKTKLEQEISILDWRISKLEELINGILEKVDETKIVSLLSEVEEKNKA